MEFHLEHGLRMVTQPEHKTLYRWAINELNAKGQPIGGDQIPWRWTLIFTATSCVVTDCVEVDTRFQLDEAKEEQQEISRTQMISITLRPGTARGDNDWRRRTTFSMFGTDRLIKNFQLQVQILLLTALDLNTAQRGARSGTPRSLISEPKPKTTAYAFIFT